MYQIITLQTLNLYNIVCQLCLKLKNFKKKAQLRKKKEQIWDKYQSKSLVLKMCKFEGNV